MIDIVFVGDLILSGADASPYFAHVRSVLAAADITVAHVEWPHTERGQVCVVDIPAPPAPPAALDALVACGVDVATLAGNHMFDQGPFGVLDTVAALRERGIPSTGAGADLDAARAPVIVERDGLTVGVLSYNAVGPRESWATAIKAGVAPVRVLAHYELDIASPGSPPAEFTSVDPESAQAMQDDIAALARECDVVAVALHKGMGFVRASLAQYERPLARMAVDAGADIVVGHHAHILRGVERYRGAPIFHGINHFVTAYDAHTDPRSPQARRPRPRRAPSLDFFTPDTDVRHFPFPSESRHTMIARVRVGGGGVREAGFIPCYIDLDAAPVPVTADSDAAGTVDYMRAICAEAGLGTELSWADGWVTFSLER